MRLYLVLIVLVLSGRESDSIRWSSKESSSMEYFTKPTRQITIPIMVHFDKALTDKLAKEYRIKTRRKLKDISKSILKEAETYYRHPTLNQTIQFSLLDTKFMRQSKLQMHDDGSTYLRNYCTKQGAKKKEVKRWWYSILLTGRDLYYMNEKGKEIRSSTGRGYMGGICANYKSCTILEWNANNIGYLLAHEIGHSLGMLHDGAPHNECKPHRNIMSSKYHPRYHPKTWSKCSKRHLEKFLESRRAWCLRKHSEYENTSIGR